MKTKSLLCGLLIALSACSMGGFNVSNNTQKNESYSFSEFSDIPIPEESMMSIENTEIYGKDDNWVGKVVYESPYDTLNLFDFFKTELPSFNWREIASIHGKVPVLIYGRYPRVIIIRLEPNRFSGSTVTMSVTPVPRRTDKNKQKTTTTNTVNTTTAQGMETIPVTQSTVFVSPDAQKQAAGSLGLGSASNVNYPSSSNGVGAPPRV
ncbi:MAG: hypothetical protein ACI4N3_04705 [Alphaproteobacteria bacterium]